MGKHGYSNVYKKRAGLSDASPKQDPTITADDNPFHFEVSTPHHLNSTCGRKGKSFGGCEYARNHLSDTFCSLLTCSESSRCLLICGACPVPK